MVAMMVMVMVMMVVIAAVLAGAGHRNLLARPTLSRF
jgi:hypothetical protein